MYAVQCGDFVVPGDVTMSKVPEMAAWSMLAHAQKVGSAWRSLLHLRVCRLQPRERNLLSTDPYVA